MNNKININQLRKDKLIWFANREWLPPSVCRKLFIEFSKYMHNLRMYCGFTDIGAKEIRSEGKAIIEKNSKETFAGYDSCKQGYEYNLYKIMLANILKTTRSSYK